MRCDFMQNNYTDLSFFSNLYLRNITVKLARLASKYFIQSQCNDFLKFRAIKFLSYYFTISYQMFSVLYSLR